MQRTSSFSLRTLLIVATFGVGKFVGSTETTSFPVPVLPAPSAGLPTLEVLRFTLATAVSMSRIRYSSALSRSLRGRIPLTPACESAQHISTSVSIAIARRSFMTPPACAMRASLAATRLATIHESAALYAPCTSAISVSMSDICVRTSDIMPNILPSRVKTPPEPVSVSAIVCLYPLSGFGKTAFSAARRFAQPQSTPDRSTTAAIPVTRAIEWTTSPRPRA